MTQISRLTRTAIAALALTGAAIAASPALAGNTCKNVFLEFTNNSGQTVNIVDVDYWDPARGSRGGWRSEPVRNETLRNGAAWRETRNLEKVNQRQTRVRFEYRIRGKLGGWSVKKYHYTTGTQVCSERASFRASLR